MVCYTGTNTLIHQTNKEHVTSSRVRPVFPNKGSGVGPEIPSFLNAVYGATQYLGDKG